MSDLAFLDAYARERGLGSRDEVLQRAVRLLQDDDLGDAYGQAWAEWASSGDGELWEVGAEDGLTPAHDA